jgi:hypothetical protein
MENFASNVTNFCVDHEIEFKWSFSFPIVGKIGWCKHGSDYLFSSEASEATDC